MQRARSMSAAATSEAASFKVPPRYRFQKHLGSGSYGVVASFHDSDRGRDVAIKRVRKAFDNFLVLRRTLREIRLMSHFRHPNLMRLHKVLPLDAAGGGDLYMSLELMDCDLDTLVHTKRVVLTDQQVRCFTAQIFLGLMAMHAGHVIHRDLKPANIFVRLNRGQVKVGDLGLSRGIAVNEDTGEASHPPDELLTEYVVTRWYRAPEVLLARSKYGPPVDVWSVGCIVYEMCSRKALFPGKNSYDQLKRILAVLGGPNEADTSWVPRESMPLLQKCYPSGSGSHRGQSFSSLCSPVCSSDGVDLLQQMCLFNPAHRIGVEQALMHPYLAGITSDQDRKTAKAVDPADVTYDKMFDGVGRQGEGAATIQLGRLLRREVAKFNPTRADTTPERSQADRTPKTAATSRTPRGGPQSTAEALISATGSARGTGSSKVPPSSTAAPSAGSTATPPRHLDATGSSDRAASAHQHPQQQPPELSSMWARRRSEPEADVWARRSGQGTVVPGPSRSTSTTSVPNALSTRRRSADEGRSGAFEARRQQLLEAADAKRVAPGEDKSPSTHAPLSLPMAPPASGPVPPGAYWLSEDKSPASKATQRSARAEYSNSSVPSLRKRIPACSGGSATTVSTRATPPGSRPGTEASTRASSRITSTSRPRVPSVGPQWAAEPDGFLIGAALGPADAATASPRTGPPALLHSEGHLSARRHSCWLPAEDSGDNAKADSGTHGHTERSSHRSLRESAATSHPGLPPDLSHHHSLASLDGVLREMKAMIRKNPDESFREDIRAQSQASVNSKPTSRGSARTSLGLRGHRAAAVGRGADTNDDRSPSCRASHRRHPPAARTERGVHRSMSRTRSHDELDFAVTEPFVTDNLQRTPQQRSERVGHRQAPAPPWAESRKPLESLEPEGNISPQKNADLGPPVPWARGGGSVRTLQDGDQDWKTLQSSWNSAVVNGSGKAHASGGHHQRQLSRTGSSVKRAAASENHMSNANMSGLGFIF